MPEDGTLPFLDTLLRRRDRVLKQNGYPANFIHCPTHTGSSRHKQVALQIDWVVDSCWENAPVTAGWVG